MTLAATGALSLSNVNTEIGVAAGTARALSWVQTNTFYAYKNINSLHGLTWFNAVSSQNSITRTTAATTLNCAANCAGQWNPSNFDFVGGQTNCTAHYALNCNQCAYSHGTYLQANCNCNCNCAVCNCNYNNCNCDCANCVTCN